MCHACCALAVCLISLAGPLRAEDAPSKPVKPDAVREKPKDGVLFGAGIAIDPTKQIKAEGAQADVENNALRIVLPAAQGKQLVSLKPLMGRWDLREYFEVRVKLKNAGQTPLTPRVQLSSNSGPTDLITAPAELAPGAEQELVIPFAPATPWKVAAMKGIEKKFLCISPGETRQENSGTKFSNDVVSEIQISAKHDGEATLLVQSIKAASPAADLPEWLGKRPPVEGEWTQTFDDEFDGAEIDQTKWNFYGPNYWDQKSHWSKDNTIIGGGVVKLRYEKKTGFQNDNAKDLSEYAGGFLAKDRQTTYASGFLDTFGKWTQRYGYFEARMKVPAAPGLWPCFWMVPERGAAAGIWWKRGSTGEGGMEFDIMEQLTRWGPHRYNIAMHWDGYQKEHKATGSVWNYCQPDKGGFITCGLLWTPGSAIYYCNGKEILRWEDPRVANVPEQMMFTLPMGGWDNSPIDDAQLPADFVIDYVRVWQRKDLASDTDGFTAKK